MLSEAEILGILRDDTRFEDPGWQLDMTFDLGGFNFHLLAKGIESNADFRNWYRGFEKQQNRKEFTLRYLTFNELDPVLVDNLSEGNNRYRNVMVLSDPSLLADNEVAIFRWDFRVILRPDLLEARVYLLNNSPASVDAVARIAASIVFPDAGKLMVHGSSILVEDRGYLFIGISGSGKSTISALSGAVVLNDEISLIDVEGENGVPRLNGTPFYGDLKEGENRGGKLAGVYLLKHAQHTKVSPLTEFQARVALMRNAINFSRNVESFDTIANLTAVLQQKVPVQLLEFEENNNFMGLII